MDISDEHICADAGVKSVSKSKAKSNLDPGDEFQVQQPDNKSQESDLTTWLQHMRIIAIPNRGREFSCSIQGSEEANAMTICLLMTCPEQTVVKRKGGPFRPATRNSDLEPWKPNRRLFPEA